VQDKLVTFGIVPQCAETGYGYIKKGDCLANKTFKVERFVEKPDLVTAGHYLKTDNYLWNSGMFMFKADQYLKELKQYRPDILTACEAAMANIHSDLDFVRVDKEAFSKCPSESIDYAVMENTQSAVVVTMNAGWSDVGCWSALWDISEKDEQHNVLHGDIYAI